MQKKGMFFGLLAVVIVVAIICASSLVETVEKGTYQIKQAAVTGKMSAKMTPGLWAQLFGDIEVWPKAETFYFTFDIGEGKKVDQSIEVRFCDGSVCKISGTLRVIMPASPDQAITLTTEKGFKTYADLEHKLVLPVVRNALRLTANLMTARESYAEKRPNYIFWAWDQIQNGLYETHEETTIKDDPLTGKKVRRVVKVISKDASGNPIYQVNPWEGTGITLANFEVKVFEYDAKVKKQIAVQQENYMAVATAKAQAEKAKQEARTAEEQGKMKVVRARYEKEQEKIRAVVTAEKDKRVAELQAEKRLQVAKLDRAAAAETKQQEILLGEGEAKRKELVLAADGALKQKLSTIEKINKTWADAYKERRVPNIIMGSTGEGGTGTDTDVQKMLQIIQLQSLKQLGLDMTVPTGKTTSR